MQFFGKTFFFFFYQPAYSRLVVLLTDCNSDLSVKSRTVPLDNRQHSTFLRTKGISVAKKYQKIDTSRSIKDNKIRAHDLTAVIFVVALLPRTTGSVYTSQSRQVAQAPKVNIL